MEVPQVNVDRKIIFVTKKAFIDAVVVVRNLFTFPCHSGIHSHTFVYVENRENREKK